MTIRRYAARGLSAALATLVGTAGLALGAQAVAPATQAVAPATGAVAPAIAPVTAAGAPESGPASAPADGAVWGVSRPGAPGIAQQPGAARPGGSAATAGANTGQQASASSLAGSAAPSTWTLSGAGAGHGVGMSQYGALAQARAGWSSGRILKFYYEGTTIGPAPDAMTLVVNLQDHVTTSTITTTAKAAGGGGFVVTGNGSMAGRAGASVSLSRSGDEVVATCTACSGATSVRAASLTMRFADGKTLANVGAGRHDVGIITVVPSDTSDAFQVGLRVRVHDEYLDRIAEMPWSWPAAALQAQAAAARSYALAKVKDGLRPSCACHVFDNTIDQVFAGYPSTGNLPSWQAWKTAVRAGGTASTGQVPKSNGTVIRAYFSASNGGWSESAAEVFGTPLPYLISKPDPWTIKPGNPYASWTRTVSGADLAAAIGIDSVARLDLSRRTAGHAVATVYGYTDAGSDESVSGATFADRLDLPSRWLRHRAERVTGLDQTAIAAAIARSVPVTAGTVVLTSSDAAKIPDSVTAPPFAKVMGAPLLLTDKFALPLPTVGELNRRVGSLKTAFIVGGPASVDQRVFDQLTARGLEVYRIDGADRYEVAKNVALRMNRIRPVTNAIVVGGTALPDALSGSGPAVGTRSPILFTPSGDLGDAAASAIDELAPATAQVLGGSDSVSGLVVSKLQKRGITTVRLAGENRYEVSVEVAKFFTPKLPGTKLLMAAAPDEFLFGALLGAPLGRPTVLVQPDHAPRAVLTYLQTLNWLGTITVIGGPAHIDEETLRTVVES